MAKKISKKIVLDYISGNDILDYDIDELENNHEFMMDVIRFTKDKNMINFCSEEVLKNKEFIKFVVETFINDLDFVLGISKNYFKNVSDKDITSLELGILITEKHKKVDILENQDLLNLRVQVSSFYNLELVKLSSVLRQLEDEELEEIYGLGFLIIEDTYCDSKIICNYFAKRLVEDIFFNNEKYTLEKLLHEKYKDFNIIKNIGINKFIIDFIKDYDYALSEYASTNLRLLNDVVKEINKIEKSWDIYNDRINCKKVNLFNEKVSKYVSQYGVFISVIELTNYVAEKLNIQDIFYRWDSYLKEYNDTINNKIDLLEQDNIEIDDIKCISYAMNLGKKLFSDSNKFNKDNEITKSKKDKNNCKVLKFNVKQEDKSN